MFFTKKIRTRFAPSPTGWLHIGGLRTALYNYILARQKKGKFYLRIEDTDQSRLVPEALPNILETLTDFGLNYDNEPFQQSSRLAIYRQHAESLVKGGHAYYCFCSAERLTSLREKQIANKQAPGYDGHCRHVTAEEAKQRIANQEAHVIRFFTSAKKKVTFTDIVRGEVSISSENIDDQVLLKSDGFPTYHLAVVIDDHTMKITHVVRGEEWLPSTPKHILLYEAFGWKIPTYAHLPLLLNKDRSKLSKRTGDVAVRDYVAQGYLREAIINFIALLGWHPAGEREIFSLAELIDNFKFENISKSGAIFDIDKLNWFNKQYAQQLSTDEYYERLQKWVKTYQPQLLDKLTLNLAHAAQSRLDKFADLPTVFDHYFVEPDVTSKQLVFKKSTPENTLRGLSAARERLQDFDTSRWRRDILEVLLAEVVKENNLTNGDVFWPVRVALSGKEKSESPAELLEALGKDSALIRLQRAAELLLQK
ncbi:MAG: glutamate--tRNA ligase [Candidatus Komeilibacteria bacterium]|nr:glutamate--tRNA ligase [Candidatus Komeilibacteria bacterium]